MAYLLFPASYSRLTLVVKEDNWFCAYTVQCVDFFHFFDKIFINIAFFFYGPHWLVNGLYSYLSALFCIINTHYKCKTLK